MHSVYTVKCTLRMAINPAAMAIGFVVLAVVIVAFVLKSEKHKYPTAFVATVAPNATAPDTWNDFQAMCAANNQQLCSPAELCPGGKAIDGLNKTFVDATGKPADNWIAVTDSSGKPNDWITYYKGYGGTRYCKPYSQSLGALPAWGTVEGPQPWWRAAACCDKPKKK